MDKMIKIKYLSAQLQGSVDPKEMEVLRGLVVKDSSPNVTLFGTAKDAQDYPLIQFKRLGGQPLMIGLGEGVDVIQRMWMEQPLEFQLGHRVIDMRVGRLRLKEWTLRVWNKSFEYQLWAWLPPLPTTMEAWREANSMVKRSQWVEEQLKFSIEAILNAMGWIPDDLVEVTVLQIPKHLSNPEQGLDISFTTNIYLPAWIGLGGNTGLGHGMLKHRERRTA